MPLGMGYGAAQGLEQVLERLFLEQQAKTRAAEAQRQMDIQMRGQDVTSRGQDLTHEVGMGTLGVNRDRLTQDQTEWTEGAPTRAANLTYLGAQTDDLKRKPQAEADRRAFEAGENTLDRSLTSSEGVLDRRNRLQVAGVNNQGSGGGAGSMAGVAKMVIDNPDLLAQLNPTARTAVLQEIARGGDEFRPGKQKLLDRILQETEDAIAALQQHPGRAGGVGMPSIMDPGSLPRMVGMGATAGSDAAGFSKALDNVKSLLTVPRLDLMRGLGPMSEREFAAMQASATKLDPSLKETEFIAELQRLLESTQTARSANRGGAAPRQAAPAAAGAGVDVNQLRSRYGY
jgi:hypothetical protein